MDAQRGLVFLAASFGIAWISIAMVAAPGPAAWVTLSGDEGAAGAFFALFSLSSAAGAFLGGRAMDRWGRRRALAAAHVGAAIGFAVAGVALGRGSLALFAAGTALLASCIGALSLTRLAAAELFAPGERARAVARVQLAATVGAIGGPLLLLVVAPHLLWFTAPPLFLLAAALVARAPEPQQETAGVTSARAGRIALLPFAAGFAALACAQGAMVTVMGVTGVELLHAGHARSTTSLVMALHFAGMFAFSLVAGRSADRAGRRATILAGIVVLALGGLSVAFAPGAVGLALGLLLIGLGWSFAYIGGTTLLTDVLPPGRRARTLGFVDFSTALFAALASFGGGLWYAERGITGLGLAAIALVALPAVLVLGLQHPLQSASAGVERSADGKA